MDKHQNGGNQDDLLAQLLSQQVAPSRQSEASIQPPATMTSNTNSQNSQSASQNRAKRNRKRWHWPTMSEATIGVVGVIVGGILTGILSNSALGDFILSRSRNSEVIIEASADNSGAALKPSGSFTSFIDVQPIYAPGDNALAQETILFLTFDLRDMPRDIRIDDAKILIPCKAIGVPKDLGDLTLQATWYGKYDSNDLDIHQKSPYDPNFFINDTWTWNDSTVSSCADGTTIEFSPNTLVDFISQVYWSQEFIQFVMYFDHPSQVDNRIQDSLIVETLPELHIRYSSTK